LNSVLNTKGVGLIEVLVALLVFTIGILGLGATQLAAKRANYEAMQRSIASSLAGDILERMRGNSGELSAYAVNELGSSALTATISCISSSCSTKDLAAFDLFEWSGLLAGASEKITIAKNKSYAGGLLDSRACIAVDDGLVSVAIAWRGVDDSINPLGSSCGQGSGLYGASHERRRLLLVKSFIGAL
jgi:type IV pilus assembly protein PilV